MNHWQLFIISATFVYFVIAAGLYAWMTSKIQPYLGLLPSELTPAFVKLIILITSFGWPLCLQLYVYWEIVDKISNAAGVNWKEIAAIDEIRMQFANKQKTVLDADQFADSIAGKKLAERVAEVSFVVEVDGQIREACFRDSETIAEILSEQMPVGTFIRNFVRSPVQIPTHWPDGAPIQIPNAEEIAEMIAKAPVHEMTKVPNEDEIAKLDKLGLAKLVYAIANDRAMACQELGLIADLVEDDPDPVLQKHSKRAQAIIDSWMGLVK